MKYSFKKKVIFVTIWFLILYILINILYGVFFADDLKMLQNEIKFRIAYNSREIIETTLDYDSYKKEDASNVLSKDSISIKLSDIDYEQTTGVLKLNYDFYMNDGQSLDCIGAILRVHDDKKMSYNSFFGAAFVINRIDYLLYDENVYPIIFDTSKLDDISFFEIYDSEDGTYQKLDLVFNLGENYEIQDNLYIEFLNVVYEPLGDFWYKAIEPLGEFKFIINF